jgi:hypothetical protein
MSTITPVAEHVTDHNPIPHDPEPGTFGIPSIEVPSC